MQIYVFADKHDAKLDSGSIIAKFVFRFSQIHVYLKVTNQCHVIQYFHTIASSKGTNMQNIKSLYLKVK